MKYLLFISLFFFACSKDTQHTQNQESVEKKSEQNGTDTAAIIANIRQQFQAIKADSAKSKHQVLEAECSGLFGTLDFQLKDDKIQAISYSYGSDHGGITEEYYFNGEDLCFVFTDEGSWAFDPKHAGEEPAKTIDEVIQTRYYFHQNAIVKSIRKQAKGATEKIEQLLAAAKNEDLKGANAAEWQTKVKDLQKILKTKKLEPYLCQ